MRRHLDAKLRWGLGAGAAALAVIAVLSSIAIVRAAAAGGAARATPSLVLTRLSPVTVRGRHFRPRIRVKLTLVTQRGLSRSARPGASGGFTLTFPTAIDRCSSWSVSASQAGRAVVLHGAAKPECAPL